MPCSILTVLELFSEDYSTAYTRIPLSWNPFGTKWNAYLYAGWLKISAEDTPRSPERHPFVSTNTLGVATRADTVDSTK